MGLSCEAALDGTGVISNSSGRLVQLLLSPPVCQDLGGDTTPSPPTETGAGYNGYFPTGPGAEETELS